MAQINNPKEITLAELAELAQAAKGKIKRIYLHWTAGRYHQVFDDYHLNIGEHGELYQTCDDLAEVKAHTWHRNTGAIGATLCCCLGAWCRDTGTAPPLIEYGSYAPTQEQIETMAMVIAVLTEVLGLDISEEVVLTHEEAATKDGYGPNSNDPETRWDLWYLPDLPDKEKRVQGGRLLRGKAIWYRKQLTSARDLADDGLEN